jgi:hypothetical protein
MIKLIREFVAENLDDVKTTNYIHSFEYDFE